MAFFFQRRFVTRIPPFGFLFFSNLQIQTETVVMPQDHGAAPRFARRRTHYIIRRQFCLDL